MSAGEMIVGPTSTLFLDEISTGLDSSTTYLIVKCMRNFVHMCQVPTLSASSSACPNPFPSSRNRYQDPVLQLCQFNAFLS